ncbi:hypothetical protein HOLleu_39294 [Holothuria leucospilota]|uniref:Calx-beta domain-containing protein n=1 Tax=Holothuria leucospilota TaxID=206669 RepID=A0A9Q1BE10_HOLLE|nr:hypothetical protein HOLleu_39294 [Holothuria leucospilota]
MMDATGKVLYILTIFVAILHLVTGGQDNPLDQQVKRLETRILNDTTVPHVYMADTLITVGEIDLYYVPITIVRSQNVSYGESLNVNLDLSYNDRRYAYLSDYYLYIPAYGTNTTIYLQVDESSHVFFTQDSVYNVTIYSCDYDCEVGSPRSTAVTVKPERNVTVSFENKYESATECSCDDCCYYTTTIRSSKEFSENIVIPLLTGSNDTATYNLDYSFDEQFVEAQPAVNLSTYTTYHYQNLYIKRDGRVEGTEYFHLRFDTNNLPDRVFVESSEEIRFEIYDGDYGFIAIRDSSRRVSEDAGTIELIVETNIIQPDKNLTLSKLKFLSFKHSFILSSPNLNKDVTTESTYDFYSGSATPGKDYIPFNGFYVIPPDANSTVIPITIINDDLAENEEDINFYVEAYLEETENLYTYGTITIEDDETSQTPLLYSFDRSSITANESSGTLEFYIRANIKNEGFAYVQYISTKENGLLEYHDYTAYFNATIKQEIFQFDRNTEYKIEVNILNDCDVEMTEMMVLNISAVSIGQTDPENYNLTIIVEDNDAEGDLDCLDISQDVCHRCITTLVAECSCGGGLRPTDEPTTEPEPEPLAFNFDLDEFEIYEGECSFYDIDVVATRPTNATVFIGIQPWELEYGKDFTISAKKLVFENNDRQNFSFRALQDTMDEDVESTLINIEYTSDGRIGRWSSILVHVLNGNVTSSEVNSRSARSIDEPLLRETRSDEFGSTAITTGLVAGLVSSVLVVIVTSILFGLAQELSYLQNAIRVYLSTGHVVNLFHKILLIFEENPLKNSALTFYQPVKGLKTTQNDTDRFVYMADTSITVGEFDTDSALITIVRSEALSDGTYVALLTDPKDTAQYNEDYSLDKRFLDPQPRVNLSTYTTYHYADVYIRKDGRLEETEYFHLRFDEETLPDRVFVGSIKETRYDIYDSDYDVTMEPTYSSDSESATPGEDYVPFARIYVLPPGASSIVIPITIINDDLAENEERFTFQVGVRFLGGYYNDYATVYIEDDETSKTPLLFFFDTSSFTANESSGTLDFYVRANIKNEAYVYLQYIPAEENGLMEYQDYTAYFNLTIKQEVFQFDKDTGYKIEVNILNDCDVEMTEMMVLNISAVNIGQVDPENYNLTIIVEDNDKEGALDCPVIGIQPWELEYGEDFTISAKKLVFESSDRQNFSFRALQDTVDEDVESAIINIAYVSDGMVGRRNAILVHVLNKKSTSSEDNSRSVRSIDDLPLKETHSEETGSIAITTGLVAGLVSSLLVVMITTILFGLAVVMRKPRQSS